MENFSILTPRQIEILKAIIIEYIKTGEPVGSEIVEKKYNLGVCPATIRNEMIELAKKGYLKKEHFSSGRIPTGLAFRFYIKNIIKEKELSTAEEVAYKNDIWDFKNQLHQLLQQTTRVLAKKTGLLALTATNIGDFYYFGVPNLFRQREFWNKDFSIDFFSLFDELSFWRGILDQFKQMEEEMLFLLGDEKESMIMESCASIFSRFEGERINGLIGVMGSNRIDYENIISNVKYLARLIEEIFRENHW